MGAIQRVAQGLLDLLSIKGLDRLPEDLLREVRPVLELAQFYGLQQQQVLVATNAALAEGGVVGIGQGGASAAVGNSWAVLFGATATIGKTATMTAARIGVVVVRNGSNGLDAAQEEVGPFGATETGPATIAWIPPYPYLLAPPWAVRAKLAILGTDANASVSVTAEIGLLG